MTFASASVDPIAALDAARVRGLAVADPVRWAVAESLARRAAAQQGPARDCLMQRLEHWLSLADAKVPPTPPRAVSTGLSALTALVDRLGRFPVHEWREPAAPRAAARSAPAPAPGALKAVAAYAGTWARLRAEQRLRQALAQVPAKAGPLNSSQVVHRSLQSLYELSPPYLDAFMAHLDTLMWLEAATGGDVPLRPAARPRRAAAESGTRAKAALPTQPPTKPRRAR